MGIRTIIIAVSLLLLAVAPLAAEKKDYIGFVNFELNLIHLLVLGEEVDMGSGLVVDFNTGKFLWHVGARIQYLNAFSAAGEAGVGFIVHSTYETNAPFTQIIPINTWTVGNVRYTEYKRIEGTCPAAWLHVVEAGVKPHYLAVSRYNYESVFTDVIFYAGYRLVSFYAEFIPIEEVEVQVHALLGLTGRYLDDWGTVTTDYGRLVAGIEIGVKWQFIHVNIAYYERFFYMDYAIRIPLKIM